MRSLRVRWRLTRGVKRPSSSLVSPSFMFSGVPGLEMTPPEQLGDGLRLGSGVAPWLGPGVGSRLRARVVFARDTSDEVVDEGEDGGLPVMIRSRRRMRSYVGVTSRAVARSMARCSEGYMLFPVCARTGLRMRVRGSIAPSGPCVMVAGVSVMRARGAASITDAKWA